MPDHVGLENVQVAAVPPVVADEPDGVRRLVLFGPPGIGKTTAAGVLARRRAVPVLRLAPGFRDAQVSYSGLLELALALQVLPAARELVAELDGAAAEPDSGHHTGSPLRLRRLTAAVLRDAPPVTLVVDNAQWLDPASAAVLGWALRSAPEFPVIVAERAWRPEAGGHWCGENARAVRVPALTADQVAQLLAPYRLASREVARIHARSGGNPALALCLAEAAPPAADQAGREPAFLPPAARRLVGEWLGEVSEQVQELLTLAALDHRPDLSLLYRLAGPAAQGLLLDAEAAALIDTGQPDGQVRFTAHAIGIELAARLPAPARRRLHARLARASHDALRRDRHDALALEAADPRAARHAARAAGRARLRGEHALAAELFLLAAQRTPREDGLLRSERALNAVRDAASWGDLTRGQAAARLLLDHDASPTQRVDALLALADANGQHPGDTDELFAAALHEAAGDPGLIAKVLIHQAIWANVKEGAPELAAALVGRAAALAQAAGDTTTAAVALTMQARVQRILGRPEAQATLDRALAQQRTTAVPVNGTPEHLAARHALFDDRLADARTALLPLLVEAEQTGDAAGTVDVLRSLAEVEIRAGRCARALEYADRAQALTERAGLSAGPACYTSALVEGTASHRDLALTHARRGAHACRQEGNQVYLSRNLFALGHLLLATGRPHEALEALEEVRALETLQRVHDPSVLRWHPDLAETLIALGRLDHAHDLLTDTHRTATALGRHCVLPALERAQALIDAALGHYDNAARRLTDAADRLHHLPLERGRTLLTLSHTERRGRRRSSARSAARSAADLFTSHGAHPWADTATRLLHRLEHTTPDAGTRPGLTSAEQRCAELAADGASNRDIAAALTISVKTVEATLTRVYRKLGLQSRIQLARAIAAERR
ncbi:LuxR C-terminal-related transcriptional regulator [Kitasatospora sp. NPDC006697]|uniref:LuxR C-terminal-related transcriptional regulator n=1 Tax=Kitasatospora sp. NPDC006697 TaxID=3364020 RepID=UPI00368165C4